MRLRLVLIACLLAQFSTAWAGDAPRRGGTLVFARGSDSTFLDPAMFLDGESHKVIENIFDGLVRYADGGTAIVPSLADSWEVSPDGLIWNFSIHPGVMFHDGTPCDAEAVVFSLRRRTDPTHPFFRQEFVQRDQSLDMVQRVESTGKYRLRVTLREPSAGFLNALASHSAYIVSPGAVRESGEEFARHPVGTGAFRFKTWVPGQRIVLERNPSYWRGAPYLDSVVFEVVADNTERFLRLVSGQAQAMDGVTPENALEARKRKNLREYLLPGLNVGYLAMNTLKPPFDKLEVRQAVNYAINKANLIKFHYQGLAIPAKNPIPPVLTCYNDDIRDYGYDPAKARQLLAQAGFPDGFETTLWAMPVPRPYMPDPEHIAASVAANLAEIGIRAKIVSHDWKTYLAKVYDGEHDMCLLGWVGSGADPDHFFHNLFAPENAVRPHASNVAFFRDPEAGRLIAAARRTVDGDARDQIYRRVQEIIHTQAPWVPLAHANQVWLSSTRAHDIVFQPNEAVLFYRAWLE